MTYERWATLHAYFLYFRLFVFPFSLFKWVNTSELKQLFQLQPWPYTEHLRLSRHLPRAQAMLPWGCECSPMHGLLLWLYEKSPPKIRFKQRNDQIERHTHNTTSVLILRLWHAFRQVTIQAILLNTIIITWP